MLKEYETRVKMCFINESIITKQNISIHLYKPFMYFPVVLL